MQYQPTEVKGKPKQKRTPYKANSDMLSQFTRHLELRCRSEVMSDSFWGFDFFVFVNIDKKSVRYTVQDKGDSTN